MIPEVVEAPTVPDPAELVDVGMSIGLTCMKKKWLRTYTYYNIAVSHAASVSLK